MDLKKQFGDWYVPLKPVLDSEEFKAIPNKLGRFVDTTPEKENIFKAFNLTQLKDVRVIILGQNPYPVPGDASGLAFGLTYKNARYLNIPKSMINIRRELESDLNTLAMDFDFTLEHWAKQGVLLLNTALTTQEGVGDNIHKKIWEPFIDKVFEILNDKHTGLVFILWGNHAKSYKDKISENQHIIESAHPSPLSASRGFFESKPFSKTNKLLKDMNNYEIKWI